MSKIVKRFLSFVVLLCCFVSCRTDEPVIPSHEETKQSADEQSKIKGFYLLNEGNMGSNKSTLDFFDYRTGVYHRNIYAERNPTIVKELGDVGNDIKIYGGKLYCVINCSNFIEIMDVATATHLGSVTVPNCRYINFYKGKAYVSSYAGPVQIGNKQLGFVAEIDTTTFEITRKVTVGYNPEEIAISGDRMYVPNSGGYIVPDYDNTLSVIDIASMTEIKKSEIVINTHRTCVGKDGMIYISGRGDYYDFKSNLYRYDPSTDEIVKTFDIPATSMAICGDSLFVISWEYSKTSGEEPAIGYRLIDLKTDKVIQDPFIDKDIVSKIKVPYTIAVNPETHEFIVTDAGDYVSPGTLYYFNRDGSLKWKQTTGDIPAHIVFW